jgi:hypothetical protein
MTADDGLDPGEMIEEVRCRRLVVVDEAGEERVVIDTTATSSSIEVCAPGAPTTNVQLTATTGESPSPAAAVLVCDRGDVVHHLESGGEHEAPLALLGVTHRRHGATSAVDGDEVEGGCLGRCDLLTAGESKRDLHRELVATLTRGQIVDVVELMQRMDIANEGVDHELPMWDLQRFVVDHNWPDPSSLALLVTMLDEARQAYMDRHRLECVAEAAGIDLGPVIGRGPCTTMAIDPECFPPDWKGPVPWRPGLRP